MDLDSSILAERILPDGRRLQVVRLTFGRARLVIGPDRVLWYADGW